MSKFICFVAILVLTLFEVSAADQMCNNRSVKIEQAPTGGSAKSTPEWQVNITSECFCPVSHLTLACPNFEPNVVVNPAGVISIDANKNCQLSTDAQYLHENETVSFTYVWDRVHFETLDFDIACS